VLSQRTKAGKGPQIVLQYASRALSSFESRYSQGDLEALAVIHAVTLFRPYLVGRRFTLVTDCKALKYIYGSEATARNEGRLGRFALRLQEYTFDVQHRAGKLSGNVDFLSRYPLPTLEGPAIEPLFAVLCAVQKSEEQATTSGNKDTVLSQLSDFCVAETRAARAAKGREARTHPNWLVEQDQVAPVEPAGTEAKLPRVRTQPHQSDERNSVRMRGPQGPEEKAAPEKTALRGKRRKLDRGLEGVAQTISLAEVEAKARIQGEDGEYQ
jgi:hypothetical protein